MGKILVTWYGITDFKASLGFEASGPVLRALESGAYEKAAILSYTDPSKEQASGLASGMLKNELGELPENDVEAKSKFVSRWCNTTFAHGRFFTWLKQKLDDAGINCKISGHDAILRNLNDSESIYQAALEAMDASVRSDPDADLTLFLSPGTPVMACCWAFASLRYPRNARHLLVSSDLSRPPEEFLLPYEWREPSAGDTSQPDGFDAVFHLFGEQRMPAYLGIRSFPSQLHIFVNSEMYPASVMQWAIPEGCRLEELKVDPYNARNIISRLQKRISALPRNARVAFNLTGGTKIMFSAASYVARSINAFQFYFDGRGDKINLGDFSSVPVISVTDVDTFIKLNASNVVITDEGRVPKSASIEGMTPKIYNQLLNFCWENRVSLGKSYTLVGKAEFRDGKGFNSFAISPNSKIKLSASYKQQTNEASLEAHGQAFNFPNWPDFGTFLKGRWLEEYVFRILKKLEAKGLISDVRTGMVISSSSNPEKLAYQEFDCAFTTKKRLVIVECKAGTITGEQVTKLSAEARQYGGVEGRGILTGCFVPDPNHSPVLEKLAHTENVLYALAYYLNEEHMEKLVSKL